MRTSHADYLQYLRNLGTKSPEGKLLSRKEEKKNKHNATRVFLHGYVFGSKKEAQVYVECLWQICGGLITDLWVHTRFPLVVNGKLIGHYIDDLDFVDVKTQEWKVVDVKSKHTITLPSYQRNKKLMRALYGIEITEIVR